MTKFDKYVPASKATSEEVLKLRLEQQREHSSAFAKVLTEKAEVAVPYVPLKLSKYKLASQVLDKGLSPETNVSESVTVRQQPEEAKKVSLLGRFLNDARAETIIYNRRRVFVPISDNGFSR